MTRWINVWLPAIALVPALALLSVNTLAGGLAALAWAFVLFPHAAERFIRRGQTGGGPDENARDLSASYWRSSNSSNSGNSHTSVGSRR